MMPRDKPLQTPPHNNHFSAAALGSYPCAVVADWPKVAGAEALAGQLPHIKPLGGAYPLNILGTCAADRSQLSTMASCPLLC
jgi:hypothetical protein